MFFFGEVAILTVLDLADDFACFFLGDSDISDASGDESSDDATIPTAPTYTSEGKKSAAAAPAAIHGSGLSCTPILRGSTQ
mmetsp:Transcript_18154/g.35436  ORF Transcript_18154/g.35436 Transcript_18154/m.35436 type:complete len:81 (+) Transcript_18154:630-872(+)